MADEADLITEEEQINEFRDPRPAVRLSRLFFRVLFGSMIVFGIAAMYWNEVLHIHPSAVVCATAAAIGAIVAVLLPPRHEFVLLKVEQNEIRIVDDLGRMTTISPANVRGVIGSAGVSTDGGEIVVWKYVTLVTGDRRFRLHLLHWCQWAYEAVLTRCPDCVGISYTGEMHLPRSRPLTRSLDFVTSELKSAAFHLRVYAVVGSAVTLGLVALLAGAVRSGQHIEDTSKAIVSAVIIGAASVALWLYSRKKVAALQRAEAAMRNQKQPPVHPRLEQHYVIAAPVEAPRLPTEPRVAKRWMWFSTLAAFIPFVGTVAGAVAIYKCRKYNPDLTSTAIIICLMSLISTASGAILVWILLGG